MEIPKLPSRVFISYDHADFELAKELADILRGQGANPYRWRDRVDYGADRVAWLEIAELLAGSDVLALVYTENTQASMGVRIELGFYWRLLQSRGKWHVPTLKVTWGHATAGMVVPRRLEIPVVDLDGNPLGDRPLGIRLSDRIFAIRTAPNAEADSPEQFAEALKFKVESFGTCGSHPDDLPKGWVALYERLFPVRAERDDPDAIVEWLTTAYLSSHRLGKPIRKSSDPRVINRLLVLVSHLDQCVAMCTLRELGPLPWLYSSYFGVDHLWRRNDLTREFIVQAMAIFDQAFEEPPGVLFEVERSDVSLAGQLLARVRHARHKQEQLDAEDVYKIETLQRQHLFLRSAMYGTHLQARILCDKQGRPISYVQPAIEEPLGPVGEVPLWLMVFAKDDTTVEGVVDTEALLFQFVEQVFRRPFGRTSPTAVEGYDAYLDEFWLRLTAELDVAHGSSWREGTWVGKSLLSAQQKQILEEYRDLPRAAMKRVRLRDVAEAIVSDPMG